MHKIAKSQWIQLWYSVHELANKPSCHRQFAIFSHIEHVQERIDDVSTIAKRILVESDTSVKRLDFEVLYMLGCQLLDLWAICVAHMAPLESPRVPYNWDFHQIVQPRQNEDKSALPGVSVLVDTLRQEQGSEMIWLDENFSSYRNRLIVHRRQPIDRSLHVVGDDIRLFFNIAPDWTGLQRQQEVFDWAEELLHAAPSELQVAFNSGSLSRNLLLSEYMVHIHCFPEAVRRRIKDLVMKYGYLSPPSRTLHSRVMSFMESSGKVLECYVKQNSGNIRLRTMTDYPNDKNAY
jgi:hypothetical protein